MDDASAAFGVERSGECSKERRDFPKDVALLRDEQVVTGMWPTEHAGLWYAAFEGPRLALCHRFVELLEVSGHDIVRTREDRQRRDGDLCEVLRRAHDLLPRFRRWLPPFGVRKHIPRGVGSGWRS